MARNPSSIINFKGLPVLSAMASDLRFSALLPKLDVAAIHQKLNQNRPSQNHDDLYPNES
jgi:hypothetical protein